MIPIFEQGRGHGIGHGLESFLERFDEICGEHLEEDRAKSFALILYNFNDWEFRSLLKDQGVFAQVDRLAGRRLSVFYLHGGTQSAVDAFNLHFLKKLEIEGES
jgi:hypothetical protein